jgi:hypothetical protein
LTANYQVKIFYCVMNRLLVGDAERGNVPGEDEKEFISRGEKARERRK